MNTHQTPINGNPFYDQMISVIQSEHPDLSEETVSNIVRLFNRETSVEWAIVYQGSTEIHNMAGGEPMARGIFKHYADQPGDQLISRKVWNWENKETRT